MPQLAVCICVRVLKGENIMNLATAGAKVTGSGKGVGFFFFFLLVNVQLSLFGVHGGGLGLSSAL